jgi:uncharacterized membrane protein YfcA
MYGAHDLLTVGSGSLVGFTLGLVGGGGSILAVPLLVYVISVSSVHVAIGTSAIAVAVNAIANLLNHARAGTVKWPCAIVFALSGVAGAAGGAALGKIVDGHKLLGLFGLLMVMIGLLMLRPQRLIGNPDIQLTRATARRLLPPLIGIGIVVGALSGFFGIGGGFLIVPGLMGATAMPLINAIGSSLVSVTAFGLTSATSYAISGLVDWRLAALFIAGGGGGGLLGVWFGQRLASHKQTLSAMFASIVMAVGLYVASSAIAAAI